MYVYDKEDSPHEGPETLNEKIAVLTAILLQAKGFNYGFVEYDDPGAAERAMSTLNGRRVHQSVTRDSHHVKTIVWRFAN